MEHVVGIEIDAAECESSKRLAQRIRIDALRMTSLGGASHIGSILSMSDIVAVLYDHVLRIDPSQPKWTRRDRFILSKGHAGGGVYAALAERGFFSIDALESHCKDGSIFSGHISHQDVPGVDFSTGSLGHGLPVACGMAYAARLDDHDHRVFVLLSDGECDEGSNWEAALFAAHHRLANVTVIIDYNKIQSLGSVATTLQLEPFADKWRAFGWTVIEVDGHDHVALTEALRTSSDERPTCVIANTVKGKGVSFMENQVLWHYRIPRGGEYDAALNELQVNA